MAEVPKIAVLLETSRVFGRNLLRGIVRYKRLHGPWTLISTAGHYSMEKAVWQRNDISGVIMRIGSAKLAAKIRAAGVPVVTFESVLRKDAEVNRALDLPEIYTDSRAIGRMAAEHLLERAFGQLAYCGIPGHGLMWSDVRQEGFAERAAEAGCPYFVYSGNAESHLPADDREQPLLLQWLRSLPKPVGVMVCNDDRGIHVLRACRAAEIKVPDEVAVVGVDDDDLICDLCDPPLSSVALDLESAGYAAAELLHELMTRRRCWYRQIVVRPLWVMLRESSDVVAYNDRIVADMLRFIREHAASPIGVLDVIESLDISRRAAEIRFRAATGHSILEQITRSRLLRCKRLLAATDQPVDRAAIAAGFSGTKSMVRAFRRYEQCSPWEYRRQRKGSSGPE
jgi:LacI family transcriptional regulator